MISAKPECNSQGVCIWKLLFIVWMCGCIWSIFSVCVHHVLSLCIDCCCIRMLDCSPCIYCVMYNRVITGWMYMMHCFIVLLNWVFTPCYHGTRVTFCFCIPALELNAPGCSVSTIWDFLHLTPAASSLSTQTELALRWSWHIQPPH